MAIVLALILEPNRICGELKDWQFPAIQLNCILVSTTILLIPLNRRRQRVIHFKDIVVRPISG